jgi:hypothetical protein
MWGRNCEPISTVFDVFRELADIISPTEFYVDQLRGFELTRGQSRAALIFRLPLLNSLPIPLLLLVLMLHYLNSHVVKHQVIKCVARCVHDGSIKCSLPGVQEQSCRLTVTLGTFRV